MTEAYTVSEIADQHVELLPEKETLSFNNNWANIYATNSAMALNAASVFSNAHATALQSVTVYQD